VWTLEFVGAQAGMAGPMLWLAVMEFVHARRRRGEDPRRWTGVLFLTLCAAPILAFYFVVTFFAPAQQNWAMAAFITVAAMAAGAVVRGMDDYVVKLRAWRALPEPRPHRGYLLRRPETPVQVLWHTTLGYGLIAGVGFLCAVPLARIGSVGRVLPAHRLLGADQRAADVAGLLERLRDETGREPFVMAHHYGVAAQMAYYLPGHPTVFCSSAFTGGRRTQYDYFRDTDLTLNQAALMGRPAVMIGALRPQWEELFGRVETIGRLSGEKKEDRPAFVGYEFKGFPFGRTAP
jgi:hypothetical protein